MKTQPPLVVLYEDNHLLVVSKPAGIATMGVRSDETSLATVAKEYLKEKYGKPGNVYLGVVSRLDAAVSGVLVFARTSKAAARLSASFRERKVAKKYWAVVAPPPREPQSELRHWLRKDEARHCMVAAKNPFELGPSRPSKSNSLDENDESRESILRYRTLGNWPTHAWLEIDLLTGRKHQIRVQLAAIGSSILGDQKYGSAQSFPQGIALHARELIVEHPTRRETLHFVAVPPPSWNHLKLPR